MNKELQAINRIILEKNLPYGLFDENNVSTSLLDDSMFYMKYDNEKLNLFTSVIRIDYEYEKNHPQIFKQLMVIQFLGTDYNNLRICLDDDTGVLWLVSAIDFVKVDRDNFIEVIENYKKNASKYRKILRASLIDADETDTYGDNHLQNPTDSPLPGNIQMQFFV